jgi:hypothetical protein
LRIGRFVVLGEHVGHRGGELVDVTVGVNVAGRLDRGVAEQLLDGLEVAGRVENRSTSGLVEWLRSCPDDGWFVEIESESTDSLLADRLGALPG